MVTSTSGERGLSGGERAYKGIRSEDPSEGRQTRLGGVPAGAFVLACLNEKQFWPAEISAQQWYPKLETIQGIEGVHLRHGSFEDGEPLKEHLTDVFAGRAGWVREE